MVQIHETIESITNTRKSYSYHQDYDQQRQQQHQNNHHETGHNSPQYTTTKKTGLNTIGFVPTMGALHEGKTKTNLFGWMSHLILISRKLMYIM